MAVQVIPKALAQGLGKLAGGSKHKIPVKTEIKEEPKLDTTQDTTPVVQKIKVEKGQPGCTPKGTPRTTPVRPKRPKSAETTEKVVKQKPIEMKGVLAAGKKRQKK